MLAARDAREAARVGALAHARARGARAVLWMSVNVPGADKRPPGIDRLFAAGIRAVTARVPGAIVEAEGVDVLGPYRVLAACADPADLKRAMVDLEHTLPAGRLLDLDVYGHQGEPVDRAILGLPQRACLVCTAPARHCIRTSAHSPEDLAAAVASLLAPFAAEPSIGPPAPARPLAADTLAVTLVEGATLELELTPKPGLVDRLDNGSHPDLTFDLMARSIALLPDYYAELLLIRRQGAPLAVCIDAGLRAEQRMFDEIGTNTHRGYIFLSGLLLLAAIDRELAPAGTAATDRQARLAGARARVRALAREFFERDTMGGSLRSPGSVRREPRQNGGGIRDEALLGLPSVFDDGWPSYSRARDRDGPGAPAAYALMATLMQRVDDTTARHRCGAAGLVRLRRDGAALEALVAQSVDPCPMLTRWNDEYRRMGLTMGGVADCMALVFALDLADTPPLPVRAL